MFIPRKSKKKRENFTFICSFRPSRAHTYVGNYDRIYIKREVHAFLEIHCVSKTQLNVIGKKSRPGLDGLNGRVPPVLRGNVLLCCERLLPLSGAPAWGQTGGC